MRFCFLGYLGMSAFESRSLNHLHLLSALIVYYVWKCFSTYFYASLWIYLFSLVCSMAYVFVRFLSFSFFPQIYIYLIYLWLHFRFSKMLFDLNSLCNEVKKRNNELFFFLCKKSDFTPLYFLLAVPQS